MDHVYGQSYHSSRYPSHSGSSVPPTAANVAASDNYHRTPLVLLLQLTEQNEK